MEITNIVPSLPHSSTTALTLRSRTQTASVSQVQHSRTKSANRKQSHIQSRAQQPHVTAPSSPRTTLNKRPSNLLTTLICNMYIPIEDPLATQVYNNPTVTASAVARQIITSTSTSTDQANPANNPRVITAGAWFDAPWVTPVCWALACYCVLSLLMLCTLYAQGVVDGKLNVSLLSFSGTFLACSLSPSL